MNVNQGMAHSFYKGKPGCGISDAWTDNRAGAQCRKPLLAPEQRGGDKLSRSAYPVQPPDAQAQTSDYDYIIFDMHR